LKGHAERTAGGGVSIRAKAESYFGLWRL